MGRCETMDPVCDYKTVKGTCDRMGECQPGGSGTKCMAPRCRHDRWLIVSAYLREHFQMFLAHPPDVSSDHVVVLFESNG